MQDQAAVLAKEYDWVNKAGVENILAEILAELKSIKNQQRQWLSIGDLSDYIGVKPATIYQYVNRGKIPFNKIPGGSRLIFSRKDIDSWIKNGNQHDIANEMENDIANNMAKTEADRIWNDIQNN